MTRRRSRRRCERVEAVLQRRPEIGLHDDAPATARWQGATRVVARHAERHRDRDRHAGRARRQRRPVTPGWLFRAGLASCAATSIAMTAAARGIALDALEVEAAAAPTRAACSAWPTPTARRSPPARATSAAVRIAAAGRRARATARAGRRRLPLRADPDAVQQATPLALHIDVEAAERDGRALRNAARRPPGRRDLHPGPLHRAVVLPVAARRRRGAVARAGRRARSSSSTSSPRASASSRWRGQPPMRLIAGDAVVFPQGDAHLMTSEPGPEAGDGRAPRRRAGAPAAPARVRRRRRDDAPRLRLSRLRRAPGADAARRAAADRARQRARLERRHLARGLGALRARRGALAASGRRRACSPSSPRCCSSKCCAST